jgi:hypothetical protein
METTSNPTTLNWTKIEAGVYETQVAGVTVQICNYRGNEAGSRNGTYWAFNTNTAPLYSPLYGIGSDGAYEPTLADAKRDAELKIHWALAKETA